MFVFGSQYLRGLTPPRQDWARDMDAMRNAGFNTIRAWLVWGVLEPERGRIDFDYLDTFLDTARQHDLKAGFLFHLHGCPEWAIADYRRCWYVNRHGLPFESSPRPNTPSGGWPGLCPDFPEVQALEASFIENVVRHAAKHQAVAFWEPINEPHMWVDLAEDPPGCFCYCEATRNAFVQWLKQKYGSLDAVGKAWGRVVTKWEHLRPPTWRFGYSDWADWRTFATDNIAALVQRRSDLIRRNTRQPVIAHAWGGGCVTCAQLGAMAFDDWKNAAKVDMWGYSAFPFTLPQVPMVGLGTNTTRNAAQGKTFWQSELGSGDYGGGMDRAGRISPEVESIFCWESIRHGAQGLLFWQFRKEAHGMEFGAFGLTDYAGQPTANLAAVSKIGAVLNRNSELFGKAKVRPAQVALLFSFRSFMADWAQHRNNKLSVDALSGYYRIFWDENIPVDVVHEEFVAAEQLLKYRLLVLPFPVALEARIRPMLSAYVAAGGTILSDPYLCAFNPDLSLADDVPGGDLAELFGCREDDISMAGKDDVQLDFDGGKVSIAGSHLRARWLAQPGTEVLARYSDAQPAIIMKTHGRGRAVISGLNFGLAYSTRQSISDDFSSEGNSAVGLGARRVVMTLARRTGVAPELTAPPDIRASLLSTADGRHILIAFNIASQPREGDIKLPISAGKVRDLMTDSGVAPGDRLLHLVFQPMESRVLLLEENQK